jgi:hypothetical protein
VHPTTVFTVGHDPRLLKLEWAEPHALVIRYPNDSRSPEEFRCESQWEDVQIKCIPFVPDSVPPLRKCHPSKDGRGEAIIVLKNRSRLTAMENCQGRLLRAD